MLVGSPLIGIVRGRSLARLAGMDLVHLMNRHLKFRHFIIILAIDQYGTLIRAAESLFVTQPALSRALREAEAAIGGPLFQRTSHGMVPTEAGRVALEHAHAIVGHVEVLDRRMTELSNLHAGSVSVGAHVTGANTIVPMAVGHLLSQHPQMNVTISEAPPSALIERLERGTLDMLVGRMTHHESTAQLELVPLYSESYRVVAATNHPVARGDSLDLEQLVGHPWVVPLKGTPLRDTWESAFLSQGLSLPTQVVECGTPAPTSTLILQYGFLGVLPESMVLDDDRMSILPPKLSDDLNKVGLMLMPQRPLTAAAQLLIDAFHVQARRLTEQF